MKDATFAEIPYKVASLTKGSSPIGSQFDNIPVYALLRDSNLLTLNSRPIPPDNFATIDIGGKLAFVVDNIITREEADSLAEFSKLLGFREEAPDIQTPPGMRMNTTVHWLATDSMMNAICSNIMPFIPPVLDGRTFAGCLSHRINFYRYFGDNQKFTPHIDGDWPGYYYDDATGQMKTWDNMFSMISMLLYLTDNQGEASQGVTRLYGDSNVVEVSPKKGSALFFRHGLGSASVLHSGDPPGPGEEKIVARINVMYLT